MDSAWARFDDDRAVANAGLALPALLMQRLGLESAADAALGAGYRPGRKVCTLVAGMLAGADWPVIIPGTKFRAKASRVAW